MPKTVQIYNTAKKPRLSFEQKKEHKKREAELDRYGVVLGEISSSREQNRFFLCFIRSLLIFMASYGMLGALVTSFDLPYSRPIVIIGLYALSFISAFLYYNRISFYVGYFVVFAGFIFFSFRFYWHINSGYQAFANEVFSKYSDFFHMLSTRESAEVIEDRYLTVTAAMLFMGWFFSILLNISISGYMNLTMTFLLTFLPLQIPFYIDIVPPLPYLVLLISVYISVAVLGRAGHFALPYRHAKTQRFDRLRKPKLTRHTYLSSSHGMLCVTAGSVVLSTLFLLFTGAIFSTDFNGKYISNRVKDTTDRFMKAVVQGGLYSLFDRYNAKGGLAHGQLGGIGNVNPDFQTDLIVRMVPYSSDNIYLKAYTGVTYDKNNFHPYAYENRYGLSVLLNAEDLSRKDAEGYIPRLTANHSVLFDELGDSYDYYGKMWIYNADADQNYDYYPYYSYFSTSARQDLPRALGSRVTGLFGDSLSMADPTDTILSYAPEGAEEKNTYEVLYLPYTSAISYAPNPTITEEYEDFVYDTYLQIPDSLHHALIDFCEESGLKAVKIYYPEYGDDPQVAHRKRGFVLPSTPEELEQYYDDQMYRLGVAATLKRYFATEFSYTMTPGTTPRNEDVVAYFLTSQKRGYCAHFASSAVMIMRSMGIPARYCEGYQLALSAVMDGRPISTDTGNWVAGTDALSDSGIVEVELSDASAHAWIEIYLDGYGWIPYEMTPPSDESDAVNLDLYNLFAGLMTQTQRRVAGNAANNEGTLQAADQIGNSIFVVFESLRFLLRPLFILLIALCALLLCYPLLLKLYDLMYIRRSCRAHRYSDALLYEYRTFLTLLKKRRAGIPAHPTLRDLEDRLSLILAGNDKMQNILTGGELHTMILALQYCAFSGHDIKQAQYLQARSCLRRLKRVFAGYRRKK